MKHRLALALVVLLPSLVLAQTTRSWTHDANGNRITRTDAEGTTSTPPDRLNRTTRLTAPDGSATLFAYTPEGRLTTLTQPNGAQTEHGYDSAGRIETLAHRQNGTQVSLTTYTYDPRGNRTGETHTDTTGTRTLVYGYDDDDRLTSTEETAPDGSSTQTTYTLDATGNRTQERVVHAGTTTKNVSYTYGPRHQLEQSTDAIAGITITYEYDANGALKEETRNGQTTQYRQNAQDRLATLTLPGAPPIQYAYDAEGRRIEKLTSTEGRRYVWDGQQIRRETNVTGNPLASYEWSSGRILRNKQGSAIAYAQHDALKSPTRWSRQDGGEQGKTRYGAWGTTESQQGATPPIGYTGHYQDPETGDYYAQQRYYRPGIGRFTRTDPWSGDELNPITLNKYLYANGNPLVFIDPDGRVGFLTDLRDKFNESDEILRGYAEESGTVGLAGFSLARAFMAVGSVIPRAVNLVSDGVAAALPGETFAGVAEEGSVGLSETVDPTVHMVAHPIQTGTALYGQAVDTTTRAMSGERGAISDAISFVGEMASGTAAARKLTTTAIAASGRAARMARVANGQSKALTVVEGADARPRVSIDSVLERRMELIADGDFGPINQPTRQRSDFYVNSQGDIMPSTGYRYMRLEGNDRVEEIIRTRMAKGSYFGFDRFDSGSEARDAFQIYWDPISRQGWSDARLRGEFDTLQLFDQRGQSRASVPLERGGIGPGLEPFARSYPEYGKGGARQLVTDQDLKFHWIEVLPERVP